MAATAGRTDRSTAATPLELMKRGQEQEVKIPLRNLLVAVMEAINSPSPPVFNCMKLRDGSGYKATIKIDVSTTLVKSDPQVLVKEVEGSVCATTELAVNSAVNEALTYLARERFVHIKDHSDNVAARYPVWTNGGSVNSMSSTLEDAFSSFSKALKSFDQLRMDFEVNEKAQTNNSVPTPLALVYGELAKEMTSLLEEPMTKFKSLKLQFQDCQEIRSKHHEETNNLAKQWRMKGYYQVAKISEKAVLAYVMTHLALNEPTYGTEYEEGCGFTGRVTMEIPDVQIAHCGGFITLAGIPCHDARDAENEAAFNALTFLEKKLKVKPVDLNFSERLTAKKNNDLLVNLIGCYHVLVDKLKKDWGHLNYCFGKTWDYFDSDYKYAMQGKLSERQTEKLVNCIQELKQVYDQSVKEYEATAANLDELQKYRAREI